MPSEVYGDRYHPQTTGAWGSVFNLGNSAIGAGVLSFPLAYKSLGYGGGILMCIVMALITGSTNIILCAYADKYKATNYQTLVRKAIGHKLSVLTSFVIFIYISGSCVAYLIIVGDTFSPLVGAYITSPSSLWADRRVVIILSSIVFVLPFILQRHLGALAGVSTLAVFVMTYTTFLIMGYFIKAESNPNLAYQQKTALDQGNLNAFKFDFQSFDAIPIIVFAYQCHAQGVPIFYEIKWHSKLFSIKALQRYLFKKHRDQHQSDQDSNNESLLIPEEEEVHYESTLSDINRPMHQNKNIYANSEYKSNGNGNINNNSNDHQYSNDNSKSNLDSNNETQGGPMLFGDLQRGNSRMIDSYMAQPLSHKEATLQDKSRYHLERFKLVLASNLRINDKIKCMYKVIVTAFIEMSLLYNLVGVTGYLLFGENVKSNIITNFSYNDNLIQFTRVLIGIAVIFHYPINIHVARSAFDSLRQTVTCSDPSEFMPYDRLFQNTIFLYLTTVLIACLVKDLGIVFQVLGGTSATLIVFILPGLILILDVLRYRKHGRMFGYKDEDVVAINLKPDDDNGQSSNQEQDVHLTVRLDILKDEVDTIQEKPISQAQEAKPIIKSKKQKYVKGLQLLVGSALILLGCLISTITIITIIYSKKSNKELFQIF